MELDNISKLVLEILNEGDFYNLQILEKIEEKTQGTAKVSQSALYTTLRELENERYILSYWQTNDDGIRMHYYFLTPLGEEFLENVNVDIHKDEEENNLLFPDVDDTEDIFSGFEDYKTKTKQKVKTNAKPQKKLKEVLEKEETISSLSKRKKEKVIKEQLEAEEIKAFLEHNSENKSSNNFAKIQNEKIVKKAQKYLLINKMNFHAQSILLIANILEIFVFFLIFAFSKNLNFEFIIMLCCVLTLSLCFFFAKLYNYSTHKTKKIHLEVKWTKQLIVRIIVYILLVVLSISIVLITGFQNIFTTKALFMWLVPSVYFLNIIFKWIILKFMSKKSNYITE